jgi:RNA recognition motif-containing protein
MNIYIGNLSRSTAEGDLRQAFERHGEVTTVKIIKDNYSGESRGFGFVEMPAKAEAEAAIRNLNGKEMNGRTITVNEARSRTESRGSGNSGGNRRY